ncbi:hypothetical protein [Paenibacillus sedimenti]|uniref:hypothetical protein n=1 Tax=Paenibacillus sedimenti TaxID=2770274 RepID=UPI00165FD8AB|nr:hypothetical protein [Paenibacillus sedimenti]
MCYFDKRSKVTYAHMLAMGVIVYSLMQMMFWYDKPSDWKGEQVVRYESIGISGEIGESPYCGNSAAFSG